MERINFSAPKGWSWKKFKDVCVLKRGYDLPTHARSAGNFPLYSANGVTDYIDQCKVDGPGVVTGRSGTIGKVHFVEGDYWPLNTALYVQKFNGNHPRFIKYFLESFDLTRFSSGAAVPTLNRNSLSAELVCTPDSVEEQKRIAEKLDALFARIDTAIGYLQESIILAEALYASELNQIFPSDIDIESLSKKDGWTHLSDICTFENGDRGKNYPSKSAFVAEGIPVVNAGNLGEKYIDHKGLNYISPERYDLLRSGRIEIGDILFCLRGSLGKVAISKDIDQGVIASSLVIIRPKEYVAAEYVYKYLKSSLCQKFISHYNNGAAQPNLSAKSLGKFMLPLPNAERQKVVVEGLDEKYQLNQQLLDGLRGKIMSLENMEASILDSAFKGEI